MSERDPEPVLVVMRHKLLPGKENWVVVPEDVVPGYEHAGWVVGKADPDSIPEPPTVPPEDRQAAVSDSKKLGE